MQKLMAEAQKMQRDLAKKQDELKNTEFEGNSELVSIVISGDHLIKKVRINSTDLTSDDIDVLEDMIMLAYNDASGKLKKETDSKLGSMSQMNGLF